METYDLVIRENVMKLEEAFAKRKTYGGHRNDINSPSLRKARDIFLKLIHDPSLEKPIHNMMEVYTPPHRHPEMWQGEEPARFTATDIVELTIEATKETLLEECRPAIEYIK